jgi:hypothetical protein
MPLHQQIKRRDDKRHPGAKVIGSPMVLMLEMTDGRQHRKNRFNHHAGVPRTSFADFHVSRITRAAMKPSVGQDDHLVGQLGDPGPEFLIRDALQIAVPGDKQAQMIEDEAQFGSVNPAPIRDPFVPRSRELRPSQRG